MCWRLDHQGENSFLRNNKSIYSKSLILRYKCSASLSYSQRAVLFGRSPAVERERESAILLLTSKSYRVLGWVGVRSVRVCVSVARSHIYTCRARNIECTFSTRLLTFILHIQSLFYI